MDNSKKLFEGLLKADSIDPSGVSEAERAVFREMLESEKKRMKHLSWLSVGAMWIFAVAMIGLCVSEKILEALRIPFVVAWLGLMAMMCYIFITRFPRHNRKLKESSRKVRRLDYLVNGRHRGFAMVGKKNGKRIIHWPCLLRLTIVIWLFMSLGGAGVYYLLCQRWIFSSSPTLILHIFFCTVTSLSYVIFLLREGLKAPLDELVEVKAKSKQSKPGSRSDIWRIIMKSRITKLAAAAVIIIAVLIGAHHFGGSIGVTSVAWADVIEKLESDIKSTNTIHVLLTMLTTVPKQTENGEVKGAEPYTIKGEWWLRRNPFAGKSVLEGEQTNYFTDNKWVGLDHRSKKWFELSIPKERGGKKMYGMFDAFVTGDFKTYQKMPGFNISDGQIVGSETVAGEETTIYEFVGIPSEEKKKEAHPPINFKCWIRDADHKTVRMHTHYGEPNKFNMACDVIEYDVTIPPGTLEVKIPEGYTRHDPDNLPR